MEWFKKVTDLCTDHHIEFVKIDTDKILFRCPRLPSKEVRNKLKSLIPSNFKSNFIEDMKSKTFFLIGQSFGAFVIAMRLNDPKVTMKERRLILSVNTRDFTLEDAEDFIRDMNNILLSDGYFEGWEFINHYDNKRDVFDLAIIKAKEKALSVERPKRDHTILDDEITDLIIAMETMTWDEFIEWM